MHVLCFEGTKLILEVLALEKKEEKVLALGEVKKVTWFWSL